MLVYQALRLHPRQLLQRLMPMLLAGVAALTLCALSLDLTINYFLESPFEALSEALPLATSFLAGALGVYFLQRPPQMPAG